MTLPDHLALYPAHYSGSVCGRGLSGQPDLHRRVRAPPQPSAALRQRAGLRRCAAGRDPAGAGATGRDRGRQPRRPATEPEPVTERPVELGLRENLAQFSLLVALNAFVGAMVGLERSTLPLIGQSDFGLASKAAVLSFIVAFGLAKAITNLGAGVLAQRLGRRRLLIAGWAIALPVPLLIARRAELGLDRRRQRPARHQPGPGVVDDGGDEDRPRRSRAARLRARPQRGGRLRRRCPRRRGQRLAGRRSSRRATCSSRRPRASP